MDKINEIMEELSNLKTSASSTFATIQSKKDEFEMTNKDIISEYQSLNDQIKAHEEKAKNLMVEHFKETGIKKHNTGLGIRVTKRYTYDDDKALQYCKDHNLGVTYDKAIFKKMMLVHKIPFVTEEEDVVIATIPSTIKIDKGD